MFREINQLELGLVSGGYGGDGLGNPTIDGPGTIGRDIQDVISDIWGPNGPWLEPNGGGIIVYGTWVSVDLGGDDEARIYEDGSIGLFRDGVYLADIEFTDGSSTSADDSGSFDAGRNGAGGSYDDGDSNTLNYRIVPPPPDY